ncbi:MAG: AI-2E family transporter [Solirubrobacteraceae bacterium]
MEGIDIERLEPLRGDVVGLRLPPRRPDEFRLDALREIGFALAIEMFERALEHGERFDRAAGEPQRSAEFEGDLAPRGGLFGERERLLEVLRGGGSVRQPLGKPELGENLRSSRRVRALVERPPEVPDGDVCRAFCERAPRRSAQRRRDRVVVAGRGQQEMRGVAMVAIVDAVLVGLALLVIGVPLVVLLIVITLLGAFVPLVGAVVAGAIAALIALVTEGVLAAVLVTAAIAVIQQREGDLLHPLVVGRAIALHPVAILLALTAGTVVAASSGHCWRCRWPRPSGRPRTTCDIKGSDPLSRRDSRGLTLFRWR